MKTFLALAGLLLNLTTGLAQPVCLDAAQHDSLRKSLETSYTPVQDLLDPGHRHRPPGFRPYYAMSPDERRMRKASDELSRLLDERYTQLRILPKDSIWYLNLTLYLGPDGSLRHFSHAFILKRPTVEQAVAVQRHLCQWLTGYRYPLTAPAPYRVSDNLMLGGTSFWRQQQAHREHWQRTQATTRPDTVTTLALTQMDLTDIPEAVYRFQNLKNLDLSGNELTEVPERLFQLPRLRNLNLTGNRITTEGLRVGRNKNLRVLNLQYNRLTRVPESVVQNRRLRSLWLGHNDFSGGLNVEPLRRMRKLQDLNLYQANLSTLPPDVGKLKRLEVLDLYHNKLRTLPDDIGRLRRLQQLAVSNNRLGDLPNGLRRLRRLKVLYAHHNFLASLPADLGRMRRLGLLDLSHNAFNYLPPPLLALPRLHELNVGQNNLTELPADLLRMPGLKKLFLNGNPITSPKRLADLQPTLRRLETNRTEVFY